MINLRIIYTAEALQQDKRSVGFLLFLYSRFKIKIESVHVLRIETLIQAKGEKAPYRNVP
jgi:hypothetical protein